MRRAAVLRRRAQLSEDAIDTLASKGLTPFSLKDLVRVAGRTSNKTAVPKWTRKQVEGEAAANDSAVQQFGIFLHSELPRRYARRIRMLDALETSLRHDEAILNVRAKLTHDIDELQRTALPETSEELLQFAEAVQQSLDRHNNTLMLTASALFRFKNSDAGRKHQDEVARLVEAGYEASLSSEGFYHARQSFTNTLDSFSSIGTSPAGNAGSMILAPIGAGVPSSMILDEHISQFHSTRIGDRVLAGHFLALHHQHYNPEERSHLVGLVDPQTSPYHVAKSAANFATAVCSKYYGEAPEVIFEGDCGPFDRPFPYISGHLRYVVTELVKNSLRATMDQRKLSCLAARKYYRAPHRSPYSSSVLRLPPVRIHIASGDEDVVVKVSDEGGGITRSHLNHIFTYLFTSERSRDLKSRSKPGLGSGKRVAGLDPVTLAATGAKGAMAGMGYGLPLSRSYARYFGGDLSLSAVEDYGSDAYLYLPYFKLDQDPNQGE